ncbi:Stress-induced protein YgiW [Stenotrophomonas geniculata]|uniref:NirD/YgiW/YdeI family stress tolerance protein n=1 Tax=Stenotrophomonas geniculata TaxID=86188 RepID=UPI00374BBF66
MNRLLAIALIATPLALLSPQAFSQYTGPGAGTAASTVADARAQRDDHPVVLRGTLISKIGDERYQFRDGSGQIEVEIDDEDLPPQAIGADTVVELRGKVDTHRFKPTDIDVDHVTVVPAG